MPAPSRMRRAMATDSSIGRIVRNAGWMLAGKSVGAVLSLIYLAAATRSLGPRNFGEFALILSVAQAVSGIVSFQTWRIVIRYGSQYVPTGDRAGLSRLVIACLGIDVVAALCGCGLAAGGVALIVPRLGWTPAMGIATLLFACVALLSVRSPAVGVLRVHDRFRDGALADSIMPVTRLTGALGAVAAGATVTAFLVAWAASEVTTAVAYWWLVARRRVIVIERGTLRDLAAVPREHPGFWRFVGLTNLSSTATAVQQQLPLLTAGLFAGPVAAGLFRFASQLSQASARLGDLLGRALFTEMSRIHARADRAAAGDLFRRSFAMAVCGGVSIFVLVAVLGKPALYVISGSAYLPAYPLLVMLGAAAALDLVGVGFEPALTAAGHAGQVLAIRLVSLAVLAAGLWWLLPVMEERGAGVAIIAASAVNLLLSGIAAYRTT